MPSDPYAIPDHPEGLKLDALRYLQLIYRDPQLSVAVRMRAAGLAIPYEVPKLAVTAMVTENDMATILDKRIKRYEEMEQMKVIEAKPINGNPQPQIEHTTAQPQIETSRPLSRTSDRRYRRL